MSLHSRGPAPRVTYGHRRSSLTASVLATGVLASLLLSLPDTARAAQDGIQPTSVGQLPAQLILPSPSANEEQEALERLERAIEEWDGGDQSYAAYLADSALAGLPTLSDWRPFVLAALLAPTGDTAGVRSALGQVDPSREHWSRWGWIALADAYEEAGDPRSASGIARVQARAERSPQRASRAWAQAGTLALEAGDSIQARNDLWTALDYGPDFEGARSAALLIDRVSWPVSDSDELRLGRALLAARAWGPAYRRLARHLSVEGVSTPQDGNELRLGLGQALFQLRRFALSEEMLIPLTGSGISPDLRAPAVYWTARAMLSMGMVTNAESTLRDLAQTHPDSPWAERGLYALLTRELETGFGPRAKGFLRELLDVGVASASAEATVVQLGSTQYLSRDYLAAAQTFEQYLEGSRSTLGRQQAGYWAALSHHRVGRDVDAQTRLAEVYEEDPLTFYGVFAGERIGAPVLPTVIPEGPTPVSEFEGQFANALTRLRVHRLIPISGSFGYELDQLTDYFRGAPGGTYEFAEALIEGGFTLEAIVLGRRARSDEGEWNLRLLRIVHPFPHREIIVREAGERGLDPFFVAGLIRQESAFSAGIASSSGALGLMQLMPTTAREVAGDLGLTYSPEILTDPETNLRLGITYLASMVRRFEGKAEDVLSAYNAGPARMRRWQQESTYQDRDVFVEHIPFQETRNYVKVVQQYARIYSALYGCENFEPCLGLPYPTIVVRSPLAGGAPQTLRND